MTPEHFALWLQGFAELTATPPTQEQWTSIRQHLMSVFHKVTPEYEPAQTACDVASEDDEAAPEQTEKAEEDKDVYIKKEDPEDYADMLRRIMKDAEEQDKRRTVPLGFPPSTFPPYEGAPGWPSKIYPIGPNPSYPGFPGWGIPQHPNPFTPYC
jgi:hypothetical protein